MKVNYISYYIQYDSMYNTIGEGSFGSRSENINYATTDPSANITTTVDGTAAQVACTESHSTWSGYGVYFLFFLKQLLLFLVIEGQLKFFS